MMFIMENVFQDRLCLRIAFPVCCSLLVIFFFYSCIVGIYRDDRLGKLSKGKERLFFVPGRDFFFFFF